MAKLLELPEEADPMLLEVLPTEETKFAELEPRLELPGEILLPELMGLPWGIPYESWLAVAEDPKLLEEDAEEEAPAKLLDPAEFEMKLVEPAPRLELETKPELPLLITLLLLLPAEEYEDWGAEEEPEQTSHQ